MKVVSQAEIYTNVDGGGKTEIKYSHTEVVLQDGTDFFNARTSHGMWDSIEDVDLSLLEIDHLPLPIESYCPPFQDQFTMAQLPIQSDCYKKEPPVSAWRSQTLFQEIKICEILRHHPHRNIAVYRGCLVDNGHITGLCFTKYHQTLKERIYHDNRLFDVQRCLQRIHAGLQHLHGLGLIHNDTNPVNIMLHQHDTTVIIEFDSCCRDFVERGMASMYPWVDESYDKDCARRENDFCGLRFIRKWIEDPTCFKPYYYQGLDDSKKKHDELGHRGQLGSSCLCVALNEHTYDLWSPAKMRWDYCAWSGM